MVSVGGHAEWCHIVGPRAGIAYVTPTSQRIGGELCCGPGLMMCKRIIHTGTGTGVGVLEIVASGGGVCCRVENVQHWLTGEVVARLVSG